MAFVPAKGDRPEWVVQGLTELGVDRIVPLALGPVGRPLGGSPGASAPSTGCAGWRGRRPPSAGGPGCPRSWTVTALGDLAARTGEPDRVWPSPAAGARRSCRPVLAVGPEGGWDAEELERFGPGVGLGPTVLRAETAALAAGAVLCGLRSAWWEPLRNHAP